MPRTKGNARILQSQVGGNTLKAFDEICVLEEYKESEGIREAIKAYVKVYNDKHPGKLKMTQP